MQFIKRSNLNAILWPVKTLTADIHLNATTASDRAQMDIGCS
jgi:hypothetical protein